MGPLNPLLCLAATVPPSAPTAASTPLWVTILIGVAGAIGALLVAMAGALAKDRTRRREIHAEAVRAVIAWNELSYRIRRRTSDEAADLARLRDAGHDLQQDLCYYQTLLAGESPALGDAYERAVAAVKTRTGPLLHDAWASSPVTTGADMNLNGWGPGDPTDDLDELRLALRYRFGLRRLVPRRLRR